MTDREQELLRHIADLLVLCQREKRWKRQREIIERIEADVGFDAQQAAMAKLKATVESFNVAMT